MIVAKQCHAFPYGVSRMLQSAKVGALLDEFVVLSIPLCQQAEQACPRQGPGCKPRAAAWVLALMIMVAVVLKKKTKSAQYRWWCQHHHDFDRWLPGQHFPGRSTF